MVKKYNQLYVYSKIYEKLLKEHNHLYDQIEYLKTELVEMARTRKKNTLGSYAIMIFALWIGLLQPLPYLVTLNYVGFMYILRYLQVFRLDLINYLIFPSIIGTIIGIFWLLKYFF